MLKWWLTVLVAISLCGCGDEEPTPPACPYAPVFRFDVPIHISLDGTRLIYHHFVETEAQPIGVYLLDLDDPFAGSTLLPVNVEGGFPYGVRLSPDNTRLVYARGLFDIFMLTIATGVETRVTYSSGNAQRPDWDPTGQRIVYVRPFKKYDDPDSVAGIRIVNLATGEDRTVRHGSEVIFGGAPRWSPDGRSIAFFYGTYFQRDGRRQYGQHIWRASPDGNEYVDLTPFDARINEHVEWFGGSDVILYYSRSGHRGDLEESRLVTTSGERLPNWPQPLRSCSPSLFELSSDATFFIVSLPDSAEQGWFLFRQRSDDLTGSTRQQLTFYAEPTGPMTQDLETDYENRIRSASLARDGVNTVNWPSSP